MTDANLHITEYGYDELNRMESLINPLGFTQTLTYDANGNVLSETNAEGETTTYVYDELERQIEIHYDDGSQVTYAYDSAGNRLSMVDSTGTTTYSYDDLYRPTAITSPNGNLSYTYDAVNQLTVTTVSGTTTYEFDDANRLVSVTDQDSNITTYLYDNAGRLVTTTLPNGVETTNTYDIADRLTNITHEKDSTVLESIIYVLDNVGNRLSMTDSDGVTTYTYDDLDRITSSVTYPSGSPVTASYTYDPMGNRLTMTEDGVVTSYGYDDADRLTSRTQGATVTNYTWDADGNLLTKGDQTFTWNAIGKLASWTDGVAAASYVYNGDGVRVSQTENSTTTNYLQDLAAGMAIVLRETEGSNAIDYVYGLDLISQNDGTDISYLLADGLGSTRVITDAAGALTGHYAYDVFGQVRTQTGTAETDFTFAGEQMDTTSGLQYLRARYYDPEDGRFISVDPVPAKPTNLQGINNYIYAVNNPIIFVDPRGESIVGAALIGVGAWTLGVGTGVFGQWVSDTVDNLAFHGKNVTEYEYSDLATYWSAGLSGGLSGGIGLINKIAGKVIGSGSKPFIKDLLYDKRIDDPWQDFLEGCQEATKSLSSHFLMEYTGMNEGIDELIDSEIQKKLISKSSSTIFFKKPLEYLLGFLLPKNQRPYAELNNNGSRGSSWGPSGVSYGSSGSGGGSWGTAPSSCK